MASTECIDEKAESNPGPDMNGKKQTECQGNRDTATTTRSIGFRNIKAAAIKKKADKAYAMKNYRDAYQAYTQAIDCAHDLDTKLKLLSNRALAYTKAARFQDALEDSKRVVAMAPSWSKGYFRLGAAHLGLGQFRDAAAKFSTSLRLEPSARDTRRILWQTILKFTTEELADVVLDEIDRAVEEKVLNPPTHPLAISQVDQRAVLREAMFQVIKEAHGRQRSKISPWEYPSILGSLIFELPLDDAYYLKFYVYVFNWCETKPCPLLLYTLRSKALSRAKAFKQAIVDSEQAMRIAEGSDIEVDPRDLAYLHCTLGDAYVSAEEKASEGQDPNSPVHDREFCDWPRALFHFTKASTLDPNHPLYSGKLEFAKNKCDPYACSKVMQMIFEDNINLIQRPFEDKDHQLEDPSSKSRSSQGYHIDFMCSFPKALKPWLKGTLRLNLIRALSLALDLPHTKVVIEHIGSHRPTGIDIYCTAVIGRDQHKANCALEKLQSSRLFSHEIGNEIRNENEAEVVAALGPADDKGFRAELKSKIDDTYTILGQDELQREQQPLGEEITQAKPTLTLSLPYESYKLVKSDGSAIERIEKHPFQMTRVYYDQRQLSDSVWVEAGNASYRWRQSASEVHIICLDVPRNTKSRAVVVDIDSHHIVVKHKETGHVYLDGDLWKGIIPEESFWINGSGDGENGFVIQLTKMNLELLGESWEHSHTWWEKLFTTEDYRIKWDDYDKDYSDLPPQVLKAHSLMEAKKEYSNMLDYGERRRNGTEVISEDARLRDRHLRLKRLGVPHWTPVYEDATKSIKESQSRWIGLEDVRRLSGIGEPNDLGSTRQAFRADLEIQDKTASDLLLEQRRCLDKKLGLEGEDEAQLCYERAFALIHATYSLDIHSSSGKLYSVPYVDTQYTRGNSLL